VDFLFSYRRGRIGVEYLNFVLIPLLCEKAGVPFSPVRSRITSHRARATIATLYYNCPDGLTGPEMQEFLGHADFRSTRSYLKATPTKLAKSVARANKTPSW
jgi:integrase